MVKHRPQREWVEHIARRSAIIYAPVDAYDSPAIIDEDAAWLRDVHESSSIAIDSESIRPVLVRGVSRSPRQVHRADASRIPIRRPPALGRRSFKPSAANSVGQLARLAGTVGRVDEPRGPELVPSAAEAGFRTNAPRSKSTTGRPSVRSPSRRRLWLLDIKGDDFRSRTTSRLLRQLTSSLRACPSP